MVSVATVTTIMQQLLIKFVESVTPDSSFEAVDTVMTVVSDS